MSPQQSTNHQEKTPAGIARQLFDEALAAFYRENDETALELFLGILETTPENLRCHYLAALCAHNLADEETITEIRRSSRRLNPRHPYTIGCEAVAALFFANYERAEHLFLLALRSLPDDIDLNIGLGILYEQMGAEEKSAEVYRRVLELTPDNIRARISLGISYALSGEYASAFAEYQYAKKLDPAVENPHQHLGRDYYTDGLVSEAAEEFIQAIAEEPDQPAAYFYLMDCYKRLGAIDDALDIYELIRERFDDQPEITSRLFEHFRLFPEAIPPLERLVKNSPHNPELLLRLSQAYQETGRIDEAIATLKKALAHEPEEAALWTMLARLFYQRQEYQEAVAAAERAVQLNPQEQDAYALLADALLFLGRVEQAEKAAKELEIVRDRAWQRYQQKFSGEEDEPAD